MTDMTETQGLSEARMQAITRHLEHYPPSVQRDAADLIQEIRRLQHRERNLQTAVQLYEDLNGDGEPLVPRQTASWLNDPPMREEEIEVYANARRAGGVDYD